MNWNEVSIILNLVFIIWRLKSVLTIYLHLRNKFIKNSINYLSHSVYFFILNTVKNRNDSHCIDFYCNNSNALLLPEFLAIWSHHPYGVFNSGILGRRRYWWPMIHHGIRLWQNNFKQSLVWNLSSFQWKINGWAIVKGLHVYATVWQRHFYMN